MKVAVTIVNTLTGRSQYGIVDEPVVSGKEVQNALGHFGITNAEIKFTVNYDDAKMVCGQVCESNNYFTAICYEVQKETSVA